MYWCINILLFISAAENILEEDEGNDTRIGNIEHTGQNIVEEREQNKTSNVPKEHVNIKNIESTEDVDNENDDSIDYEIDSDSYESANSDDYESALDSENLDEGNAYPGTDLFINNSN